MERGVARKLNNFRPKCTEVIWHTRWQDIMDEIANILGMEEVTTETQGWFASRTPAIKNIINRMTGDELSALDIQVEEIALHGYDEILQRRYVSWCYDANANANANRLAKKYNAKHVEQAMQDQFKEMGMTSVVFVCYTQLDGKLVIDA